MDAIIFDFLSTQNKKLLLKNVKIVFSYDGSKFCGSQKQCNKKSVEDKILEALKVYGIQTKIILSGRTDTGVHAVGQCANFFVDDFWANDLEKFRKIINYQLSPYIFAKHCEIVDTKFHSRYDAKTRTYRYIINTSEYNVFGADYFYFHYLNDITKLQECVKLFQGTHDFEYFSKTGSCTKTTIRTIYDARIYKYKNFIIFKFEANGFLRSQIRMMVGALLSLSEGKITLDDLDNQILKIKKASTKLAPASGLYLCRIKY